MYGLREASVSRAIRLFVNVEMKFLPNEDDIYSQMQISGSRELNTLLAKIFDLNFKLKKY